MFKIGQVIFGIEVVDNDFDKAEISGYLFMAECGNYVICCAEDMSYEDDFESQLDYMYEDGIENFGVDVVLLKKELCFDTEEKANEYLTKLQRGE